MHTRFEINTIIVQFRKIRKSNKSRRNFSDTFFIYIYYIYIQTQIQDDTCSGISQLQKTYFFLYLLHVTRLRETNNFVPQNFTEEEFLDFFDN